MKHPMSVTITLLLFFLTTQLIGLFLVSQVMPVSTAADGSVVVLAPDTAVGPPPETTEMGALLLLLAGVTIGTLLILLLVKFRKYNLWKVWFFLAAGLTMTISFGVIFGDALYLVAGLLGFILAALKVFRPNPYIHNFTELFIYPGIAVLFYHILTIPVMLILLAIISVYDIIAVFKSKHMVSMANFQTSSNVFAGLAIPRASPSTTKKTIQKTPKSVKKSPNKGSAVAVLGGGDVALPLLFAAVVLKSLVEIGLSVNVALSLSAIIALTSTLFLALLFFFSQKGKFYPAMPTVSFGAILGWIIILLLI